MMRRRSILLALVAAAACGGAHPASPDASPDGSPDGAPAIPDATPSDAPVDAAPGLVLVEVNDGSGPAPAPIAFADTRVGARAGITLFLIDTTIYTTDTLAFTLQGDTADFAIVADGTTCTGGTYLGGGQRCTLRLAFTPTAAGPRSAVLHVVGAGDAFDRTLTGTGLPPPTAGLVADVGALDFGPVELGQPATLPVILSNAGTSDVATSAVALSSGFASAGDDCPATLTPGGACTIDVRFTPSVTGLAIGTLTTGALTVPLRGIGLRRVTVVKTGTGTDGLVTSAPFGITCGATCSGLFLGDVTLSMDPGVGFFGGWGLPCGADAHCTLPDGGNVTVTARFESLSAKKIVVFFEGAAPGFVRVLDGNSQELVRCTQSCITYVASGAKVTLHGQTPSTFGGWTGDCTSSTRDCALGTVVNDRTAMVTFDRDERELTTILPSFAVNGVAFAGDGGLVVASPDAVREVGLNGAAVWTRPITGGASDLATDGAGDVFARGGDGVVALSPAGSIAWTRSLATSGGSGMSFGSAIATSADGTTIAVLTADGAHVFDASGADRFTVTGLSSPSAIAVAPDGTVAITTLSANVPEAATAHRYDKTGAALADLDPLPGQYDASIAYDAQGDLCADTTGHGNEYVSSTSPTDTLVFAKVDATGAAANAAAAVVVDGNGDVIAARDSVEESPLPGLTLHVYSPAGTLTWTHDKPPIDTAFFDDAVWPFAIASQGQRLAVGGSYGYATPWIQVYTMP